MAEAFSFRYGQNHRKKIRVSLLSLIKNTQSPLLSGHKELSLASQVFFPSALDITGNFSATHDWQLVLHIQYECHLANVKFLRIKLAINSTLSSRPAIVQFFNSQREIYVAEGYSIPPNLGKSKAVFDNTIRGYFRDFRDMIEETLTRVRALSWNETYGD